MERREFVFGALLTCIPLSGCIGESVTDADGTDESDENAESARIRITNHLKNEVTLTINIKDQTQITETIPADEVVFADSGITETETQTVNIHSSTNDETEYQWHVSDWDITGSGGLSIEIHKRGLSVSVLE